MRAPLFPLFFSLFLTIVRFEAFGAEEPRELGDLHFGLEVDLAELSQPVEELNRQYRGHLAKQREAFQKAGKLEEMLAVEEESKIFDEGDAERALSTIPELKRLQEIYRQQKTAVEARLAAEGEALLRAYGDKAGKLASQWTREGKIDEAKLALAESKRLTELAKNPGEVFREIARSARGASAASGGLRPGERKPGEESQNGMGMKLCWIPPGKFTMGSPAGEQGRDDTREAQVDVELTRGFWMGKFEVSQKEFETLMGHNPSKWKESGKLAPVEMVSWNEAAEFCRKLTEAERKSGDLPEGWHYQLPTEAQWEYACRAGSEEPYWGGDLYELGWYAENSGGRTHDAGQKKANGWGLHDMHGNVRERCLDWLAHQLEGGIDPMGPQTGSRRINRGGSWKYGAREARAAHRGWNAPEVRDGDLGFRVAMTPVQ